MWRTVLVSVLSIVLVGSILIHPALGKEYPTKPIELFCAFPAGGSIDYESRLVARVAEKYIEQPIVVINKTGAAGTICAAHVINSKPDGYSLAMLTNTTFALIVKTQKIKFDPQDLIPLANMVEFRLGLMVRGDAPWKTLNDMLDYAKKNPGKLRWGFTARGTLPHILGLGMFRKAGVDVIEVPYRGGPQIITAMSGGHLDAFTSQYGVIREHIRAGLFKCLVFFSEKRYPDLPDIPSALELGFPEVANIKALLGVYVHKNTPEYVKKTLFDALKKISEDPEFKEGIRKIADEPKFGGPEFMRKSIKEMQEMGIPILKNLGLYVEE